VASETLETVEDLYQLRELNNNYVTKEVLERFLRLQILRGIKDDGLFNMAVEMARGGQAGLEELREGCKKQVEGKRSYIEWKIKNEPGC
jgi:hypothetical protein